MRLGVFGGTFNPPHIGHLIAAEHVREALDLERILFLPAATPPHKDEPMIAPHHRMEMVRRAIQDNPHFLASELEIVRGGMSYTVDSLSQLSAREAGAELMLLVGMDLMAGFGSWKSPEQIVRLARIVVMSRPDAAGYSIPEEFRHAVQVCPVPAISVSSSDIRRRVREGMTIRYLVPPQVEAYIQREKLYRREKTD